MPKDILEAAEILVRCNRVRMVEPEPLVELYVGNGDSKAEVHQPAAHVGVVHDIVHDDAALVDFFELVDHPRRVSPRELGTGQELFDDGTDWLFLPFGPDFGVATPVVKAELVGQSLLLGRIEFQVPIALDDEVLLSDLSEPRKCPTFAKKRVTLRVDLALWRSNALFATLYEEVYFLRKLELSGRGSQIDTWRGCVVSKETHNLDGVNTAVDLCFHNMSVEPGSNHVEKLDGRFLVSARVEVGQSRAVNVRQWGFRHSFLQDQWAFERK